MPKGYESKTPLRTRAAGPGAALLLAAALVINPALASAQGDATRGKTIYERCQACHSLNRNRSGPKHCGLIGRKAGTIEGYRYSKAMRNSGIVWNLESLEVFLENPFKVLPGTRMGYAGVKDPQERADLIAFLAAARACDG